MKTTTVEISADIALEVALDGLRIMMMMIMMMMSSSVVAAAVDTYLKYEAQDDRGFECLWKWQRHWTRRR
jgi:hypothetical protein